MAPRLVSLAALLAALVLAPAAGAAPAKRPTVKVADCDTSTAAATFEASMRRVKGSDRLQLRFTLEARTEAQPVWTALKAPGFDTWLSSRPGRARYVYDKTVQALPAPGEYRVTVRFRWRDAEGAILAQDKRRSKPCVQPDPRPDLQPTTLTRGPGGLVLTVANVGAGSAPATPVTLAVGMTTLTRTTPALAADGAAQLRFEDADCDRGSTLVATVDPGDELDEADEAGNALTVPCPS